MPKGIYVCEEAECVGPFASRTDAEIFVALMKVEGGGGKGIEIVEVAVSCPER